MWFSCLDLLQYFRVDKTLRYPSIWCSAILACNSGRFCRTTNVSYQLFNIEILCLHFFCFILLHCKNVSSTIHLAT